jgi:hypothetical protein
VPFRASARGTIGAVTDADLKELMEEIRDEMRLNREEHRRNQARFANSQAVMREMVIELRVGREILKDIQDGIRANTEGLLRVLDELRRGGGPSPAGA